MANKEVEFHEAASEEFEAAFDWYLERSAGAAARFASELGRAITSIAEAPHRWPAGIHGTRKLLLRRFPFAVVYRELPSTSAGGAAWFSPARKRWAMVYRAWSTGGAARVPYLRAKHRPRRVQHRRKVIEREFHPRLRAYIAGICKKAGVYLHSAGGTEDHIHLLIQLPPDSSLAKAVATIKSNSSRWANEEGHRLMWQQGCGAFSVSAPVIPVVDRYIRNQEEHRRKMDFDAEFLTLLRKHGLEFDPKYVFG